MLSLGRVAPWCFLSGVVSLFASVVLPACTYWSVCWVFCLCCCCQFLVRVALFCWAGGVVGGGDYGGVIVTPAHPKPLTPSAGVVCESVLLFAGPVRFSVCNLGCISFLLNKWQNSCL
jgi:hypothetical protein